MSDIEKTDMPSDTQDTFFEESGSNSEFTKNVENANNSFPESQDFHLLDTGDSQEIDEDLPQAPINDTEIVSINKESDDLEKIIDESKSETPKNETMTETMTEQIEDDEDIVQGTPPPLSPSKKLAADLKTLKRRADFTEDSQEDLLQIKRNKIDDSDDDLQKELESMENDDNIQINEKTEESNIVPETQESTQDKTEKNLDLGMENSLEEECDLVNEAIDSVNDGDENQNDSTVANFADNDVSNQNDISIGKDLNETKESQEIDFSDISFNENGNKNFENENLDETKDIEKQNEIIDNEDKQEELIENEIKNNDENDVKENIEDSKIEVDELDKTNSIEDALKQLGGESDTTESSKQPIIEKESTESELLAVLTDSDTNAEVDEVEKEIPVPMETETTEVDDKLENDQLAKSRMSIEVIYDRSSLSQEAKLKSAEVVEIDDDDAEKIIIDSSRDDSKIDLAVETNDDIDNKSSDNKNSDFNYNSANSKDDLKDQKTETPLINGDDGEDLDTTVSQKSDSDSKEKMQKVFIISDSEGDSLLENKSQIQEIAPPAKILNVEKEFVLCVKLKCLLTIDENTKEILSKEILGVNCEANGEQMRNSDTSTSLADISGNDNKDSSPGSVTSATYPRFSIMSTSTISSTTSSSSSGSLAPKNSNDKLFSVPKGKAKHTKKISFDEKSNLEFDQLTKEWKNPHLVSTSVLSFVITELNGVDLQNGVDVIDDNLKKIRSSTPESSKETPQRNLKKGRPPKRLQTRGSRKRGKIVATTKTSPNVIDPITEDSDDMTPFTIKENKAKSTTSGFSTPVKKSLEGLRNSSISVEQPDDLLGKDVFAKWSDNNYYAGKVVDKNKSKYKVNFLDGKSKQLISEFLIPISKSFGNGLSVYTLTKDGDYGPCGMIIDVVESNNKVSYVVEPDEGKKVSVQIKDIFLTPDQAQVLKEEVWGEQKSLPSTPHSISQVIMFFIWFLLIKIIFF